MHLTRHEKPSTLWARVLHFGCTAKVRQHCLMLRAPSTTVRAAQRALVHLGAITGGQPLAQPPYQARCSRPQTRTIAPTYTVETGNGHQERPHAVGLRGRAHLSARKVVPVCPLRGCWHGPGSLVVGVCVSSARGEADLALGSVAERSLTNGCRVEVLSPGRAGEWGARTHDRQTIQSWDGAELAAHHLPRSRSMSHQSHASSRSSAGCGVSLGRRRTSTVPRCGD
jgi:hypothetical protein